MQTWPKPISDHFISCHLCSSAGEPISWLILLFPCFQLVLKAWLRPKDGNAMVLETIVLSRRGCLWDKQVGGTTTVRKAELATSLKMSHIVSVEPLQSLRLPILFSFLKLFINIHCWIWNEWVNVNQVNSSWDVASYLNFQKFSPDPAYT